MLLGWLVSLSSTGEEYNMKDVVYYMMLCVVEIMYGIIVEIMYGIIVLPT